MLGAYWDDSSRYLDEFEQGKNISIEVYIFYSLFALRVDIDDYKSKIVALLDIKENLKDYRYLVFVLIDFFNYLPDDNKNFKNKP